MKKFLKSAVAAAAAVTLTAVSLTASATEIRPCDVNDNGITDIADVVLIMQYVGGSSDVFSPEVADFDNDGFVTNVDATRLQEELAGKKPPLNPDYTPSIPTNLTNSTMPYTKYSASTGDNKGNYVVPAAELIFGVSTRSIIGTDDLATGDYHKGLCKIKTALPNGTDVREFTGFVSSDDTIMTAAQALSGRKIVSIQFFNSSGNIILNANATDYSIPRQYNGSEGSYLDYAVINVSNDLSNYKTFEMGYALNWASESEASVSVAGFIEESSIGKTGKKPTIDYTGSGNLKNSSDQQLLNYNCDTDYGMVGAPIFKDVVHNGSHHYVVVGINTSDGNDKNTNNSGVRICPNITNLVRNN